MFTKKDLEKTINNYSPIWTVKEYTYNCVIEIYIPKSFLKLSSQDLLNDIDQKLPIGTSVKLMELPWYKNMFTYKKWETIRKRTLLQRLFNR